MSFIETLERARELLGRNGRLSLRALRLEFGLSDHVPGQFDRPNGCLFSPRCELATLQCTTSAPDRQSSKLGNALCYYPLKMGKPTNHPGREDAA